MHAGPPLLHGTTNLRLFQSFQYSEIRPPALAPISALPLLSPTEKKMRPSKTWERDYMARPPAERRIGSWERSRRVSPSAAVDYETE